MSDLYLILGQLVILITTILGIWAAAGREKRKRDADVEDAKQRFLEMEKIRVLDREDRRIEAEDAFQERRRATEEIIEKAKADAVALRITVEARAEALRIETVAIAERLRLEAIEAADDFRKTAITIEHKIGDVHQVATEAKEEARVAVDGANHVNVRIEDLNQRLEEVNGRK